MTDLEKLLCSPAVVKCAKDHAIACFPAESCGGVLDEGYRAFTNVSPDPLNNFDCDIEARPFLTSGRLKALIHSHPNGPIGPTATDMRQQLVTNLPWGIVVLGDAGARDPYYWGDTITRPPLEGRLFRHGPSGTDGKGDCYALIRDWYLLERGIELQEGPRDDSWWLQGGNLYLENYKNAGFVEADPQYPEVGDVALIHLPLPTPAQGVQRPKHPQHGGIYVGGGRILHHLPNRFSRVETFSNWVRFLRGWLRYAGPS